MQYEMRFAMAPMRWMMGAIMRRCDCERSLHIAAQAWRPDTRRQMSFVPDPAIGSMASGVECCRGVGTS